MRKLSMLLVVLFFLCVVGCATVHKDYISEAYNFESKSDKAIIFGSVTQSKNVLGGTNASFYIDYWDKHTGHYLLQPKKVNSLWIGYRGYRSEFPNLDGNIFAFEVPAGKH